MTSSPKSRIYPSFDLEQVAGFTSDCFATPITTTSNGQLRVEPIEGISYRLTALFHCIRMGIYLRCSEKVGRLPTNPLYESISPPHSPDVSAPGDYGQRQSTGCSSRRVQYRLFALTDARDPVAESMSSTFMSEIRLTGDSVGVYRWLEKRG
jgi:hypothetical protein